MTGWLSFRVNGPWASWLLGWVTPKWVFWSLFYSTATRTLRKFIHNSCLILVCFMEQISLFFAGKCLWVVHGWGKGTEVWYVILSAVFQMLSIFCNLTYSCSVGYLVFLCLEPLVGCRATHLFSVHVFRIQFNRLKLPLLHFVSCFRLSSIFFEIFCWWPLFLRFVVVCWYFFLKWNSDGERKCHFELDFVPSWTWLDSIYL